MNSLHIDFCILLSFINPSYLKIDSNYLLIIVHNIAVSTVAQNARS